CSARPVTLPPGRARPATRPAPTGSLDIVKTIGIVEVSRFNARTAELPVTITSTFRRLGCDLGATLRASLIPAILDCDGATLDPAEFTHSLHKGSRPLTPARCIRA